MLVEDLGPLLEGGTRVGVVVATVVLAVRVLNATFDNSRTSWEAASVTLTESAVYARQETAELRARVDHLEDEARAYAVDRAAWLTERATMTARIAHLETLVTDLTAELETFRAS